jgi:uncharacterized protein YjbJ (UPF0337 family)
VSIATKIAHTAEAVKGSARKTAGRVTGSRRLRPKGRRDQANGNLKQTGRRSRTPSGADRLRAGRFRLARFQPRQSNPSRRTGKSVPSGTKAEAHPAPLRVGGLSVDRPSWQIALRDQCVAFGATMRPPTPAEASRASAFLAARAGCCAGGLGSFLAGGCLDRGEQVPVQAHARDVRPGAAELGHQADRCLLLTAVV